MAVAKYPVVDPQTLPWPFAGLDEAGRGCLAGPVVAAAVILPQGFHHSGLRDSKKLSPEAREQMRTLILQHARAWAVAESSAVAIGTRNILQATFDAMWQAVAQLEVRPQLLAVDGNRFRKGDIPHQTYVQGEDRLQAIAAASILAKTHRDALMLQLHALYPLYGWDQNKGYATADHRERLLRYGPSPEHRDGFRQVDQVRGRVR